MAINSINTNTRINDINANTTATRPTQTSSTTVSQLSRPGVSAQDLNFGAAILKDRISASIKNPTTPPPAAQQPRQAFQAAVARQTADQFGLPANAVKQDGSSFAVNSANQLQTAQLQLRGGGTMTQFFGLPPSNPIPATTTAQLPRVVLDPQGVLSFAKTSQPLSSTERTAIRNLYAVDQVSRGNYAANVQNLASALTAIKNTSKLSAGQQRLIDNQISTLGRAYNQLANFKATSPDPDTLYNGVGKTLSQLSNIPSVNQDALKDAANILGIGYSNYQLNRIPVNGTNNPATTTRGPLAAFNAKAPLAAAQSTPEKVFGAGLTTYLNSIGIKGVNPAQVNFQVNSANAIQAATVPLGNGQNATFFFTGQFPPTNANPPQIAFSGARGARQFADVAQNAPATQQRLDGFYKANAAPRAAYVTNLNNLIAGFQSLQKSGNSAVRLLANDSVSQLQRAVNGLNAASPVVPNVLGLYQRIGDNLDAITANQSELNAGQRDALDTLNRSTLPIGITNYFARPVVLSQQ